MASGFHFLHISDIHFRVGESDPYHRTDVLNELIEEIRRRPEDQNNPFHIHGIVVSGDIAWSGDSQEYDLATTFFDRLIAAAHVAKDRLLVVPGNHDVDCRGTRYFTNKFESEKDADNFCYQQQFFHFNKFHNFKNWHDAYFANIRQFPLNNTFCKIVTWEQGDICVSLLPANSALFCLDGGDAERGQPRLMRGWLREATNTLNQSRAHVRFVIMHHPLDWLHNEEQEIVRRLFESNAHALLTGHIHTLIPLKQQSHTGELIYISAGAAHQNRRDAQLAQYVRLRLHCGHITIAILPIRYHSQTARWIVDTSYAPALKHHEVVYTITRSPASAMMRETDIPEWAILNAKRMINDATAPPNLQRSASTRIEKQDERHLPRRFEVIFEGVQITCDPDTGQSIVRIKDPVQITYLDNGQSIVIIK